MRRSVWGQVGAGEGLLCSCGMGGGGWREGLGRGWALVLVAAVGV